MPFWGATEIKDFVEEADFIQVSAGQSLETPFMLKKQQRIKFERLQKVQIVCFLTDFVYTITESIILSVNVINSFLFTF